MNKFIQPSSENHILFLGKFEGVELKSIIIYSNKIKNDCQEKGKFKKTSSLENCLL